MYLHLPTLLRALRSTFSRRHFNAVHAGWTLALGALFFTLRTVVLFFRGLDYLLYPAFRQQKIASPLFIIGNPRSGTTFLHRLVSLDSQFTTMQLIETIVPSVSLYRLSRTLRRIDAYVGRPLERMVVGLSSRAFSGWSGIHSTRLSAPEEDEQLFVYTFLTPVMTLLFPFFDDLSGIGYVDRMSEPVRDRVMKHYISSIRRHLYARVPEQTLLVKNTSITGRLQSTIDAIPDVRIVHVIRHPYETIASLLSMYSVTWARLAPQVVGSTAVNRALADLFCDYYRYRFEVLNRLPDSSVCEVRYEELVAHPAATVRKVYDAFDLTLTPEFEALLDSECRQARSYRSRHMYHLSDFSVTESDIHDRLRDVFDRYDFDPNLRVGNVTSTPMIA